MTLPLFEYIVRQSKQVLVVCDLREPAKQGGVGHHLLASHGLLLDQHGGGVSTPVGLVKLAVAHALVIDEPIRRRLPSEYHPSQLRRGGQNQQFVEEGDDEAAEGGHVERPLGRAGEEEDGGGVEEEGELQHAEGVVGDREVASVVERTPGEEVDLVDPVHEGEGEEGDEDAQRGGVGEEDRHHHLVDVVAVPLGQLVLGILELLVELALELAHRLLRALPPVPPPPPHLPPHPRGQDQLVEEFNGGADGDEEVGVEVEVAVRAEEEVEQEEREAGTQELREDGLVHVGSGLVDARLVTLSPHQRTDRLLQHAVPQHDHHRRHHRKHQRAGGRGELRLAGVAEGGEDLRERVRVVEQQVQQEEEHVLDEQDQQRDEVGVQLHPLLLVQPHAQVLPVDVDRTSGRGELEHAAVVDEALGVPLELVQEEVAVVLVLEGHEGVAHEVREVEEEAVVGRVLVVEDDPAVVDEVDLLGQRRKTVLLLPLPPLPLRLLHEPRALLLPLVLLDEGGARVVDDLQAAEVVAQRDGLDDLLGLELALVGPQHLQVVVLVRVHPALPGITALLPRTDAVLQVVLQVLAVEELGLRLALARLGEVQHGDIADQHRIGLFRLTLRVDRPVPGVLRLAVEGEQRHRHQQRTEVENVSDQQHGGRRRSGNRVWVRIRTSVVAESRVEILYLADVLRVHAVGHEGGQHEEVHDSGLEDGEEDSDPGGQLKLLIVMLHLDAALRSAVTDRYGVVVHTHAAAGTHDRDRPLEVLPEAELGSVAMQDGLADQCGVVEGLAVSLHLLPHGVLDKTDLDTVRLDLLAQLRETAAVRTSLHNDLLYIVMRYTIDCIVGGREGKEGGSNELP